MQTADLVSGIRAPFVADIHHLRGFAANLDRSRAEIDRALQVLPIKLDQGRPDRHLRLVVQLLPLPLQGQVRIGRTAVPVRLQHRLDRCDLG